MEANNEEVCAMINQWREKVSQLQFQLTNKIDLNESKIKRISKSNRLSRFLNDGGSKIQDLISVNLELGCLRLTLQGVMDKFDKIENRPDAHETAIDEMMDLRDSYKRILDDDALSDSLSKTKSIEVVFNGYKALADTFPEQSFKPAVGVNK